MTWYKAFFTAFYFYRLCFHNQRTFGLSIKRVFVCLNVNFKTVISLRRKLVLYFFLISDRVFWPLLIDLSSSVSKAIYFLAIRAASGMAGKYLGTYIWTDWRRARVGAAWMGKPKYFECLHEWRRDKSKGRVALWGSGRLDMTWEPLYTFWILYLRNTPWFLNL